MRFNSKFSAIQLIFISIILIGVLLVTGNDLSGIIERESVLAEKYPNIRMVEHLFWTAICLLAVFNVFIYVWFIKLIFKKEMKE